MANLWRFPSVAGSGRNPVSAKTTNITQGSAYDEVASSAFFGVTTSVTHYTLTLDTSSYTVTGVSSTLVTERKAVLEPSTYSVTGSLANLKIDLNLNCSTSTYNIVGFDVTFSKTTAVTHYSLALDTTSFNITGFDNNLFTDRFVNLTSTVYGITGIESSLNVDRLLILSAANSEVTGFSVTFQVTVAHQRGGKSKRKKIPKWLRDLLKDFDEDWEQQFVKKVEKKEVEELETIVELIPYASLDTSQIYFAIELINKEIKRKEKAKRIKEEEEILIFFL